MTRVASTAGRLRAETPVSTRASLLASGSKLGHWASNPNPALARSQERSVEQIGFGFDMAETSTVVGA